MSRWWRMGRSWRRILLRDGCRFDCRSRWGIVRLMRLGLRGVRGRGAATGELLVFALGVMILPRVADTCGPFLTDFRFTSYHGALPGEFESARLGVVRPHYYRADLLMAYRE